MVTLVVDRVFVRVLLELSSKMLKDTCAVKSGFKIVLTQLYFEFAAFFLAQLVTFQFY